MPALIRLEGLGKTYPGGTTAVQDLTLGVAVGETLALLGPSGSGKSTVLRLIAGLEVPDAGEIWLDGRCVAGADRWVPPERRSVGLVFQDYALFPHLTVQENIAFGLRTWSRDRRRAQVMRMMALVGLGNLGDRHPHQLSGGQQQRVALARALAPEPDILLLDEPFSSLDADRRASVRAQVRELLARLGATVLFVTHDQEEALFMGDRVAILSEGRLEQLGTPRAIYEAPASRAVAQFLGNAYFLPAIVTPDGLLTACGLHRQPPTFPEGTPVEVLVRPDDLTLEPAADGTAKIAGAQFQGMHMAYDVTLPGDVQVRCLAAHITRYRLGTPVRLLLTPGHALTCFPVVNGACPEASTTDHTRSA